MESLSGRSKVVVKKEMTFAERMYLPAIIGGALITLKHLLDRPPHTSRRKCSAAC